MDLGARKSPWDNKRLTYAVRPPTYAEAESIPLEWDGLKYYCYVRGTQGGVPSCIGWSAKGLTETLLELNDGIQEKISAGSLYFHSRELTDLKEDEGGSYPIAVMKVLQNIGASTEECSPTPLHMPFNLVECSDWKEIASMYKISSYHYVETNEASMKAAIYGITYKQPYKMPDGTDGKCPLYIAIPVYTSFYHSYHDGIVPMPLEGESLEGGHAILVRGWKKIKDKYYWIMVNSWGTDIGDDGIFYLPFEYPIWEAWMVSDDSHKSFKIVVDSDNYSVYDVNLGDSFKYVFEDKPYFKLRVELNGEYVEGNTVLITEVLEDHYIRGIRTRRNGMEIIIEWLKKLLRR